MKRKKWLIGNWKMHGTQSANQALIDGMRRELTRSHPQLGMAICPAFPHLQQVSNLLVGSNIVLGAQNLSEQAKGAYTGEISGAMLKDLGVDFVIIGHSERRSFQNENDSLIAQKVRAALDAGITPILCIGETKQERESDQTETVLRQQLGGVLPYLDPEKDEILIAYEPRWAIGTGISATPDMIETAHGFLRKLLEETSDILSQKTPILYGGSMNASNAASIAGIENVDGGLIGSASLKTDEFIKIHNALLAAC